MKLFTNFKLPDFCKPLISIKNGVWSMLSEEGKISVKRSIAALFAITLAYMVWFFLNKIVPPENQATFRHCFDVLCGMILLMTGVATVKDIYALRTGRLTQQDKLASEETIKKIEVEAAKPTDPPPNQ